MEDKGSLQASQEGRLFGGQLSRVSWKNGQDGSEASSSREVSELSREGQQTKQGDQARSKSAFQNYAQPFYY